LQATIPIPDAFGSSFSEKAIRQGFIRKVYMILLTQLAVTTAFIAGTNQAFSSVNEELEA